MVMGLADTLLLVLGLIIFGCMGWHATTSDTGTVRLYQKYTGLSVADRWVGGETGLQLVKNLVRPFGTVEGKEKREARCTEHAVLPRWCVRCSVHH